MDELHEAMKLHHFRKWRENAGTKLGDYHRELHASLCRRERLEGQKARSVAIAIGKILLQEWRDERARAMKAARAYAPDPSHWPEWP